MKLVAITLAVAIVAAAIGSLSTLVVTGFVLVKSQDRLIAEFYDIENAVHVSPHSIRKAMDKGNANFVLVDLRSREEYEREHIVGAVSIPAYADPDTSAYNDIDRIVGSFRDLQAKNPGKDIIVYCYSIPCMTGRKIGKMLADRGIYVKHLGIGWNEWRHFWNLWNHEHEWNTTNVLDYIAAGPEPGKPKLKNTTLACGIGEFSC